jgi:hypothetical protein
MDLKNTKGITILSLLLALSLAAVSICGAFFGGTYERETASLAAQGVGQDLVDLFLVLPLLILSLVFIRKNSRAALFLFGGGVLYTLYSFIIYSFGIHFNFLFLLYCATLGLSLYLSILFLINVNGLDVEGWFDQKAPILPVGIFLIVVALVFYLLWLKELIPAVLSNTPPPSVTDYGILVNPVHVIDIAFALPGLILAAFLLMRKKRLGFILAPSLLVFLILMTIALAGMIVMLKIRGISEDLSAAAVFIILTLISTVLLILFLKHMKKPSAE